MKITHLDTAVYRFPTPEPEADGTLEWDATTAVVVIAHAGDVTGLGWTYSTGAAAAVIRDHLAAAVVGQDTADVAHCWEAMRLTCRNIGTRGLVMQAISAVDIALWDLKARTLDRSLRELFGQVRSDVPVYGSGGFTTMPDDALAEQIEQWRALGCHAMKITIGESWGRRTDRDLARVERLRELAPDLQLDATRCGGYTGFASAASLAAAHNLDVSAHCAPALHAPIAAATVNLRHVEYFADHARLEPLLVENTPVVADGAMRPNDTIGHGLALHIDAQRWRA